MQKLILPTLGVRYMQRVMCHI